MLNAKESEINQSILVAGMPYEGYQSTKVGTPKMIDTNEEYEYSLNKNLKEEMIIEDQLPLTGGFISTDVLIIIAIAFVAVLGYVIFNLLRDKKVDGKFNFKNDDFVDRNRRY